MKKLRITNILFLCSMILGLVFVYPNSTQAALSVSKTWNDQADWQPWSKSKIEDDGGGLQLTRVGDFYGEYYYETTGTAQFQFSPGGIENSWKSFSRFVGDTSTAPAASSTLTLSFSTDNVGWYSEANLNNGTIPDSASLYIKATFKGDGTESPILKSLTLNYETKEEQKMLILKDTFLYGDSTNPVKTETSTFEPGDTALVRIKMDPMGMSGLKLVVRDYRPKAFSTTEVKTANGCGLGSGNMLAATFSPNDDKNYSEWSNVQPNSGISYLCYTYKVDNPTKSENNMIQSRLLAYDQDTFDANQPYNQVIATFSGYSMVRGFAFGNSESDPVKLDDGSVTPQVFPIDDFLSFARTVVQYTTNSQTVSNLSYSASYVYKKGLGPRSRGGELYSLPVKMKDSIGQVVATDQSYILYNPAFYLFGNLFSGSSLPSNLDFSSRSGGTSNQKYPTDFSSKLNSEASLYNYFFDKKSVLYWDNNTTSTEYKNTQMTQSINDLITNKPPEFCPPAGGTALSVTKLSSGQFYLDGPKCNNPATVSDNTWPNGRVWYFKTSGTVNIAATFHGRGTVIIDGDTKVNISTTSSSFPDDNTSLGLIVINGGKVVFTKAATTFNGIVFDPGQ